MPADAFSHHSDPDLAVDDEEAVEFLAEPLAVAKPALPLRPARWRVLTVDDDRGFQRSLSFALSGELVAGRAIEHLQAYSMREAVQLLLRERDIALILLDVVMEADNAGLRLVRSVREVLGNAEVRIVLLTGQPGVAPMPEVIRDYDISDYWIKSELTPARLSSLLTANLRTYEQLQSVVQARRGLQMIVESSNLLFGARSLREFSARVLSEVAALLGLAPEGVLCARLRRADEALANRRIGIISAVGSYASLTDRWLDELDTPEIVWPLQQCFIGRQTLTFLGGAVLYFPPSGDAGDDYAALVAVPRELAPTELELLHVFARNVASGLHNVSLMSRLDKMAYEDSLTPLPNRNALVRALDFAMEPAQRAGRGLLLLDIDGFSGINIAFGPGYGNDILRRLAIRLRNSLDASVFIARVSKDIFALLGQTERIHPDLVRAVLNGAGEADDPLKFLTLGTALVPLDALGGRGQDVLELAGLTLKQAKLRGHCQHEVYHPDLEKAAAESFRLLERIRQAVDNDRLSVVFQPQIDLRSGKVQGVEALARLHDEHGVPVSPDVFIPLTETTGLILEMGERIFAQSCQAAKALAMAGFATLKVAINLSVVQLIRPEQMERVLARLAGAGIDPEQLEVEVTESVAMLNFDAVRAQLQRFQFLGLTVAIDDFGTGFSSLAYLSQLPADRLKIDRRFVEELGQGEEAGAIADMIIKLAIRLGKTVVAEGVETEAQARWLHAHGCHYAQGYHYARPMPLAALLTWLDERRMAQPV